MQREVPWKCPKFRADTSTLRASCRGANPWPDSSQPEICPRRPAHQQQEPCNLSVLDARDPLKHFALRLTLPDQERFDVLRLADGNSQDLQPLQIRWQKWVPLPHHCGSTFGVALMDVHVAMRSQCVLQDLVHFENLCGSDTTCTSSRCCNRPCAVSNAACCPKANGQMLLRQVLLMAKCYLGQLSLRPCYSGQLC